MPIKGSNFALSIRSILEGIEKRIGGRKLGGRRNEQWRVCVRDRQGLCVREDGSRAHPEIARPLAGNAQKK